MKRYTLKKHTYRYKHKENKCITKKITLYKPKKISYSPHHKSILIDNNEDIEKYFSCYKISNIVKLLCEYWIQKNHGCFLDITCFYEGTIYLTLTKKSSFYNHIHIFPLKNSFNWHDKKSKTNGKCTNEKNLNKYINLFENMLKK